MAVLQSTSSKHKPPSRVFVTQQTTCPTSDTFAARFPLFPPILPTQNPPNQTSSRRSTASISQSHAVTLQVSRTVLSTVDLGSDDCAAVSDGDLEAVGHGAFGLAAYVYGWPGEHEAYGGVDPGCGEEDAGVGYARLGKVSTACGEVGERKGRGRGRTFATGSLFVSRIM